MGYVGGLRDRLIVDNLHNLIHDSLDALGWFDDDSVYERVEVRVEPVEDIEEIRPNMVVITDEDVSPFDYELGSNFSEYRWQYFIDVYAESQVAGRELSGDIRAILEGKLPSIGRVTTNFVVYDLTQATPSGIFHCDIENISSERGRFYEKPFQKYWWMISFQVVDFYGNEDDED
jgi:hypothetical protein